MSNFDADPGQQAFDAGCYWGRHLLGRVVAEHARNRVLERLRDADGTLQDLGRYAGDHAFGEAWNDHMTGPRESSPQFRSAEEST